MAHGVILAAERALGIGTKAEPRRPIRGLAEIARVFVIFTVVSILWLLFKFPSYSEVFYFECVS